MKVWYILSLSFVVGLAQAFGGPAYQALIPTLVAPKDLANAIALNSIQFNLARVIGPMLGGIALTSMGAAWCFTFNGISFVAVIISLLLLPVRPLAAKTGASMLTSIKEGLQFYRPPGGYGALDRDRVFNDDAGRADYGVSTGGGPGCISHGREDVYVAAVHFRSRRGGGGATVAASGIFSIKAEWRWLR